MEKGDTVICINHFTNFFKPFPNKAMVYIVKGAINNMVDIKTIGIPESNSDKWRCHGSDFRLANKEDLKEYLEFIFTNEKIWIKVDNKSEVNLIAKIINKKYPYSNLKLNDSQDIYAPVIHNYFNRKQLWSQIKDEEEWLKEGYSIIEFKDIKYIIQKVNEKSI